MPPIRQGWSEVGQAVFFYQKAGKSMRALNNLENLVITRRLMIHAQRAEDRRKGKVVKETSIEADMQEDSLLLSGNLPGGGGNGNPVVQKAQMAQTAPPATAVAPKEAIPQPVVNRGLQFQVRVEQTVEREASFSYSVLKKVDGLVRNSQNEAETDRYRFEFTDGINFTITDKWSKRSTTVWGDPHVDVDDVEGNRDGEFSDLTTSNLQTSLMLQDGTRVTFTAPDSGVIEEVDIIKGNQHLGGIGAGSKQWNPESGLFAPKVDYGVDRSSSVPIGDVVYAGGDGNDWFSSGGQLLWGKTTGPVVSSRPYAVMHLEYSEKISQQINVQFNKQT